MSIVAFFVGFIVVMFVVWLAAGNPLPAKKRECYVCGFKGREVVMTRRYNDVGATAYLHCNCIRTFNQLPERDEWHHETLAERTEIAVNAKKRRIYYG